MSKSNQNALAKKAVELLEARRQELAQNLRRHLYSEEEPGSLAFANHLATAGDRAEANELADTDMAITSHITQELRQLEAALRRIASGGYGTCAECGVAIPPERLRAQPEAQCCLTCMEKSERHAQSR